MDRPNSGQFPDGLLPKGLTLIVELLPRTFSE